MQKMRVCSRLSSRRLEKESIVRCRNEERTRKKKRREQKGGKKGRKEGRI